jgi:hypothetical protein
VQEPPLVKVRLKSAIPLYGAAAVWLLMGLLTPIYRFSMILVTFWLSIAGYLVLERLFPGRTVEVRARARSGDDTVDRQIEEGRRLLQSIHVSNEAIPDESVSARISRMEAAGEKIFGVLEKDTTKKDQVRRFMTYYLPTTDKLLTRYRELADGGAGENVTAAKKSIENSLEMIAVAFEKQLDALYSDSALDIETDIEVLETMVKSEGHTVGTPLGGVK